MMILIFNKDGLPLPVVTQLLNGPIVTHYELEEYTALQTDLFGFTIELGSNKTVPVNSEVDAIIYLNIRLRTGDKYISSFTSKVATRVKDGTGRVYTPEVIIQNSPAGTPSRTAYKEAFKMEDGELYDKLTQYQSIILRINVRGSYGPDIQVLGHLGYIVYLDFPHLLREDSDGNMLSYDAEVILSAEI